MNTIIFILISALIALFPVNNVQIKQSKVVESKETNNMLQKKKYFDKEGKRIKYEFRKPKTPSKSMMKEKVKTKAEVERMRIFDKEELKRLAKEDAEILAKQKAIKIASERSDKLLEEEFKKQNDWMRKRTKIHQKKVREWEQKRLQENKNK